MNTTIRFLFLQQLYTSPFFVSSTIAISNSRVSNGFANFAFNIKYFYSFSSTFSNFLQTPIFIDSENSFHGMFIERPKTQPMTDYSVEIVDSEFYNCVSNDNDGGAIYFKSQKDRASLNRSVFQNCRSISKSGGAFYFEVKSAKISFVCGSQCFAAEEGQFFFLFLKRYGEINNTCSIDSSLLPTLQKGGKINRGGVCIHKGRQIFNFFNSTRNAVHGESASLLFNSQTFVSVAFSHFENNQGLSIIDFLASESELESINFVNNSGKFAMIQFKNHFTLKNSKFIFNQNYIRPFSVLLDDGEAKIIDSFFNIPRVEVNKVIFKNCSFNEEQIQIFPFSQFPFTFNIPFISENYIKNVTTNSTKKIHFYKKHFDIENEEDQKTVKKDQKFQANAIEDCPGPNTIRNDGKCQCLPRYPFGDPDHSDGCWRCINQCHKNAICASPGKCVCADGYLGDGQRDCILPVPHLKSIIPKKVKKHGLETINLIYETDTNLTALQIFCRIGTIYSVGDILSSEQAMCVVPKSNVAALKVSMSFDNKTWSEENVYLMFSDENSNRKGGIVVVRQVWALFAIVAIVVFTYMRMRRRKIEEKQEAVNLAEREAFNPSKPRIGANNVEEQIDI